jgi:HAE1 family hydrophobic/amphiphilic exporter-1
MLCSRFLKPVDEQHKSKIMTAVDNTFDAFLRLYDRSLVMALENKLLVVSAFVIMAIATAGLFVISPKGFMPNEDTGQIVAMTEGEQGISFDSMASHHKMLCDIITADENVQSVMSSIGVGNGSPNVAINQGRILIVLKPRDKRPLGADQVIAELAPKLSAVEGISAYLQNPPSITIGGQVTKSLYQFTLSSPNRDQLYSYARQLQAKISQIPGLTDVTSDLQIDNPEVHVVVDRDKCAKFGLTMQQVEDALDSAYATRQISTMYTDTNQYWVILEVQPKFYRDPGRLHSLYVMSTSGTPIPLDTVAEITLGVGPLLINHLAQFPSVTISFNLKPGAALGNAVNQIKALAADMLPPSISTSFQGSAQSFQDSLTNLWALLAFAVLVIYIVLGILYESFIHPLTILSGLPSAGLGALVILMLFHVDLNIYGFLGLIMLIGIVKKNAIMMIDFALDAERNENMPPEKAIYQACLTRFRPIMMTTMAALMGAIPIAIGLGAGSEARQPLGLTVVGGLLVSQMVTLYITPVFYIYLDRFQRKVMDWQNGGQLPVTLD